jgi:hypothetical protein
LTKTLAFLILLVHPKKKERKTMTILLQQSDFDSSTLNMWAELVRTAQAKGIVDSELSPEDVEEVEIEVVGAFVK